MPPTPSMQLYRLGVAFLQDNLIAILLLSSGLCIILVWKTATWKTRSDADHKILVDFMQEIRDEVKEIFKRLPALTTQPGSPTTLTDLGKEIAQEIQIAQWVPQYAREHLSALRGENPYEVQKACLYHARTFLENHLSKAKMDDTVDAMKMSAFQHGVSLEQVQDVAGIALRDEVLKLLNISPE